MIDTEKIKNIMKDIGSTPNKSLIETKSTLLQEFEETRKLVIDLTRHMDLLSYNYDKITDELNKRGVK